MPLQQQSEHSRPARSAEGPDRRVRQITVAASHQEYNLLKRRAAARGMGLGPYLRAAGLGLRTGTSEYAELAREVLAIGHAFIAASQEQSEEHERLLSFIRPVVKRITGHLP